MVDKFNEPPKDFDNKKTEVFWVSYTKGILFKLKVTSFMCQCPKDITLVAEVVLDAKLNIVKCRQEHLNPEILKNIILGKYHDLTAHEDPSTVVLLVKHIFTSIIKQKEFEEDD